MPRTEHSGAEKMGASLAASSFFQATTKIDANLCGNSGCGCNPNRNVRRNQIPLLTRLSSLERERL